MNEKERKIQTLKESVKQASEFFEKGYEFSSGYLTEYVAPTLKDILKGLCPKIEKLHKFGEAEEEKFVIHYTSINTLMSMLNASINGQNASLRLYDSVHFNDPDEGNYLVHNLLPPNNDESNYLVRNQNLLGTYGWSDPTHAAHAYIASFIIPSDFDDKEDMSDNLVFWRAYGKEGEGCSLKLRIPSCRLRKVFYGVDEMECTKQILHPVLDALSPLTSITKRLIREDVREKLADIFCESLEGIRYLYKSEAYKYERECRFVMNKSDTDKSKIRFEYKEQDNSPPYLRHYYEDEALSIEKMLTSGSSVTLGPCVPYSSDVSNCLEIMRDRAELKDRLQIKTSKIPYRKS